MKKADLFDAELGTHLRCVLEQGGNRTLVVI